MRCPIYANDSDQGIVESRSETKCPVNHSGTMTDALYCCFFEIIMALVTVSPLIPIHQKPTFGDH